MNAETPGQSGKIMVSNEWITLGQRCRALRTERHETLQAAAKAIGLDVKLLRALEADNLHAPKDDHLALIARYYHTTITQLRHEIMEHPPSDKFTVEDTAIFHKIRAGDL